jgi:hypothetical protein
MLVDPASYVGNVYGVAPPNARVIVRDDGREVRSGIADAEGNYLINSIPTPDDGADYTIECAGISVKARVLPGAAMALEADFKNDRTVRLKYRHEEQAERVDELNYTRSIFATREGLVGGTTANGHVIVPNDHFVALPSRRALSTNGGHEREVRLTYRGITVTAPVWDVGPWNTKDDYWSPTVIRETFKDLPRGMPESEAAFTQSYNGGNDERGRHVSNPAGIDLADGTFLIDLGLSNNDRVTVEYLWLDQSGPFATNLAVAPAADGLAIDAQISDATTGNSPLSAAEMYVDFVGEDGSGFVMTPIDGTFDSPTEAVRGTIDAPSPGIHVIYVHARDAYGNWGPISARTIAIGGSIPRRRAAHH